jgi:two-component system, chemotaxis family, protein-glutamate methylesterase/glutaminase
LGYLTSPAPSQRHTVIVVGTSAGGLEALANLLAQLPNDLSAAMFIVQHLSADSTGSALLDHLNKVATLPCQFGESGQRFERGRVYIAPPDHHMLVKKGTILVTKGARENRSRPSIDPLFRSAAVAYGGRVIGVILTGQLDDGTSGLQAIARCGGLSVVQDPKDARYPDMPNSALRHVRVDHCVPLASMGSLLVQLVSSRATKQRKPPADIVLEAKIAERVLSDLAAVNALGQQVPFNCPECAGVLWKVEDSPLRFRCHTGHAFTANALANAQTGKIQETLWIALRMFEERKNLLQTMTDPKSARFSRSAAERAREADLHIERLRAILLASEQ